MQPPGLRGRGAYALPKLLDGETTLGITAGCAPPGFGAGGLAEPVGW